MSDAAAALATPSPIEDVAGPSEADIEAVARELVAHGEFSTLGEGANLHNARKAAFAVLTLPALAARRVRPSPCRLVRAQPLPSNPSPGAPDMATDPRLTARAQRQMEESFDNEREAWKLLDLINAEFTSDPMSTQCFDARIVQRVKECVEKRKHFEKTSPFYYGDT